MEQHIQRGRIDEKSQALSEFSKFCALLSSENRLKIVLETAKQERSVGEISDLVGLSQSATSQHLKILRDASVLSCRREKQNSLYSVTSEKIKRMLSCI